MMDSINSVGARLMILSIYPRVADEAHKGPFVVPLLRNSASNCDSHCLFDKIIPGKPAEPIGIDDLAASPNPTPSLGCFRAVNLGFLLELAIV